MTKPQNLFKLSELPMEQFSFIVHLFDRILVGKVDDLQYRELVLALERDEVLEAHFFNKEQEVFAARVKRQLVAYRPLLPLEVVDPTMEILTRCYEIEDNKYSYNTLIVKEYIDYEDDLAYVKQTMLYDLEMRAKQ
ncbi:hypothetical protein [Paenibacillus monticola]|uniref:Uncharacterized protein n=1 Tax=Paenibacillus monticola TaxID=2666075 RepID=A0A7X2H422_9BACL|nr:hypothetical protein [Paenibacillus monticola]MRN53120.1 hypothetical protein [Paenibacillus monticola]